MLDLGLYVNYLLFIFPTTLQSTCNHQAYFITEKAEAQRGYLPKGIENIDQGFEPWLFLLHNLNP